MLVSSRHPLFLAVLLWLAAAVPKVDAILYYDNASATHNISAPTGAYVHSGWQYEGYFGSYLGTMIAPTYFITAQHFGVNSSTFVYDSIFSGVATQTFAIDTVANGGIGYYDITGTDLRIYHITGGTFSTYAPVYNGTADVGSSFVVTGRGAPRGAAVNLAPDGLKGWQYGSVDGVARWGRNTFDASVASGVGTLLSADFDAVSGQEEADLTNGDSGGGSFIFQGGMWQLAGINYGVEGSWDTNNVSGDGTSFSAALFDKGGFYEGSDSAGWTLQTNTPTNKPSKFYVSRVSDSAGAIAGILSLAPVPEPGGGLLMVMTGAAVFLQRKRRKLTLR